MSSTSRAGRPSKEKMTKSQTAHSAKSDGPSVQSNKQQPTVEQMRFANILSEQDDPQLASKIKQVMELTGKSYDDATVALYDCDNDTNKAVNLLLEQSDQGEWQETTKKKKRANQKTNDTQAIDGKGDNHIDKREKSRDRERTEEHETNDRKEREGYGGRGNRPERPPRLSRGGGQRNNWRGRDNDENDNSRSEGRGRERGGGRGRGRGQMNGPGRGRGRGGRGGFGSRNRGGFSDRGPQIDTWTNETAENAQKDVFASNWAENMTTEDWTSDEWTGTLEESQVFTASAPREPTNSFTEQQSFTAEPFSDTQTFSSETQSFASEPQVFSNVVSESQVFTNSLSSDTQSFGTSSAINSTSSFGQRLDLGVLLPPELANDNSSSSVTQQSQFMSQYAKQGTESIKNALGIGTTASQASASPPSLSQRQTHSPTQPPLSQQQALQQRSKPQRSKLPPPSKIPASAVEMPGHSSFGSLDVQFGNWDPSADTTFSSEGFSFGGEGDTSAVVGSFANTTVSTTTSTLTSHLPITSCTAESSSTTSSIISSVTSTKSSIPALENMTADTSTARGTVYQNSSASTTPTKDYREASLQQAKLSSPPEPIPFPDRKTSPHYAAQRSNQPGSLSSGKTGSSQQLPFNQSGYPSSYQNSSSSYQQHKPSNLPSSYQHSSAAASNSANSNLTSHNLPTTLAAALHSSQYSSHPNYQSQSSYQTQSGYPTNQSSHTQNSLYHGSNQASSYNSSQTGSSYQSGSSSSSAYTSQPSAYQTQSGASYQSGSSSSAAYTNQSGSSYQNQAGSGSSYPGASSGAYQNQASSYHSRDSQQTGSAFPSGSNQSGSATYQSGASQLSTNYQHQPAVTQSSGATYQRDSQTGQSGYSSHASYGTGHQTSSHIANSKLSDNLSKMSVKDTSLESRQTNTQHSYDHTSSTSSASLSTTTTTTSSSLASGAVASSIDMTQSTAAGTTSTTNTVKSSLLQSVTGKVAPTNPPPGVPPLLPNYIMGQPGMPYFHSLAAAQQPVYSYEELQLLQQRLPMPAGYYDMTFQPPTTPSTRDQSALASGVAYSGADGKLNRVDAQSPVQAQSSQQQTQAAAAHQQTFINPTIPPGYGYYYPTQGMPLSGFSYTPTMFPIPPAVTNAAHGGTTANPQFQKQSYASHYASAYDELSQAQDFKTAYGSSSQAQNKGSSGSSVGSSSAADITGVAYGKHAQSYDKQSFHAGTPPPFNLALPTSNINQAGPMGGHTAGYAPYMHPGMIHQQQMLHHPLQQDSTGGSSRASQQSSQPKGSSNKAYSSPYWAAN